VGELEPKNGEKLHPISTLSMRRTILYCACWLVPKKYAFWFPAEHARRSYPCAE